MQSIKFHTAEYEVVGVNISAVRFQVTLKKGDATIDSIVTDTENANTITIIEDGETKGVYTGYTDRIAISIYNDDNISVELKNADLESQIAALENSVAAIQSDVSSHSATINDIVDSQATQDLAIEDLGDAVSELSEG